MGRGVHQDEIISSSGVVGFEFGTFTVSYNTRDLLLYALGIGCSTREDTGELRFLFEEHEDFQAFPTYPLVLPFKGSSEDIVPFPGPTLCIFPPGLENVVNPATALHYDQSMTILGALDPDGATLQSRSKVVGFYGLGKGALLRTETTLSDEKGQVLVISTQCTYFRGLKVDKDVGPPLPPPPLAPCEPPNLSISVPVHPDQALLYRLSGDYNPLHADPDVSAALGLKGVIVHGLCTLGMATRQVCLHALPDGSASLQSISARFAKPVHPGDVMQVHLWFSARCSRGRRVQKTGTGVGEDGSRGKAVEVLFEVTTGLGDKRTTVISNGRACFSAALPVTEDSDTTPTSRL